MNKRLFALLLVFVLLFSACADHTAPAGQQTRTQTSAAPATTEATQPATSQTTTVATTEQPNQSTAGKLSFDQAINKDMYQGFSDLQIDMLNQNGFVVLQPKRQYPYHFLHHLYEHAEYGDKSIFITTDAVLNMFHMYYSGSLKALETMHYYNDMVTLTNSLMWQLSVAYGEADQQLKPYYQRLYAYVALAGKLLQSEEVALSDASEYNGANVDAVAVKDTLLNNSAAWGELVSLLPAEVSQLVDADYEKIANSNGVMTVESVGLVESHILGKRIDATQYLPRGHYTQSSLLKNFFKGMMWYSQSGFDISIEQRDNLVLAQLLSKIINDDEDLAKLWNDVYAMTAFYSGASDDLNYKDIVALTEAVYGADYSAAQLLDSSYDQQLAAAIDNLPAPQIKPVVRPDYKFADLDYDRQYRLMGQRFSFDSYAMTELVKSPERLNISVFDVLATTGNQLAEQLLYEYYDPAQNWPQYPEKLAAVKAAYNDYKAQPNDTLYRGWFRAIDLALNEVIDGEVPYFMQSAAYAYKRINTALGSFAELKHDNVLYAKQMVAEAGGGDDDRGLPLHFVEPNIELYQTLLELVEMAQQYSAPYQDETITKPLDEMAHYLKLFIEVSRKELNGELTTQDELREIAWFGGMVDYLRTNYNYYLLQLLPGDFEAERTSALVTDIATILEGGYLEVGIGLPYHIYALVEVNGEPVITEGSVYSAASFYSNERLTDESWHEAIGLIKNEYDGYDYSAEDAAFDIYQRTPHLQQFVAPDENNVEYKYIEMHWPKE